MEELLPFILLWIIITIFNLISKRLKKAKKGLAQSATTAASPPPKSEIPRFLQEILGKPKRDENSTFQDPRENGEDDEGEEKTDLEEEIPIQTEVNQQRAEIKGVLEEEEAEKNGVKEKVDSSIQYRTRKKKLTILKTKSLKMAVIWKEILDKPISLRRTGQGRNFFLK